jgi:nucleotide-binding universal stress UspA family protein
MAQFFRRILCPVDFDESSIAALDYAADLAKDNDAALYLLHVVSGVVPIVSQQPSLAELEGLAGKHVKGKVRYYELLTRSGDPAEVIMNVAQEMGVDVVVMATHGRKGVGRLFLGSVAEKVVRGSARPVLTIRPGDN